MKVNKCALLTVSPTPITFLYATRFLSVKKCSEVVKGRIPSRIHGEKQSIDTVQFETSLKKAWPSRVETQCRDNIGLRCRKVARNCEMTINLRAKLLIM
jgi:hypothetical protein